MLDEQTIMRDEVQQIFFGFSVTDLIENYNLAFINCIDRTMSSVEATLLEERPQHTESIKRGIPSLRNLYIERAKVSIQKLETELEKIFNVSNNVTLPIVGSANINVKDEDIEKEIKEIDILRDQLLQERVFLAKLEEHKKFFDNNVKIMIDRLKELFALSATNLFSSKDGLQDLIEILKKAVID